MATRSGRLVTGGEVPLHAHVAAVVLAAMGGARLERSLASVAWARERIVLDPAARVDGRELPAGVRYIARPVPLIDLGSADWLLLILEGEVASPRLAAALAAHHADASGARAFAVPVEMHAIGTRWKPRPAVRLAARTAATLVVRDGRPELAAKSAPPLPADACIVVAAPPSLEAAVQALDAESAAVAAWLHRGVLRVKVRDLLFPPVATVARVLLARGGSTRPWARWVAAVLAGYRTLLVPARVWELHHLAAIQPPHAGGA